MDLLKRTKLAVLLAAFALLLAACGGSEEPAATDTGADAGTEMDSPSESEMMSPSESEMMGSESEMAMTASCELPAEGEPGSLSAMTEQPAGTAASTNPCLTTLTAAVTEAGLVDTLNGEGPFTIFAPVDDAFEAVPEDTLQGLMADQEALTDVLTYHVVSGQALQASDLAGMESVETANGGTVTLAPADETVSLNGNQATVIMPDIQVGNGVVHLIDGVLMPQ